ncbi:hypothetical protein FB451DRAFT_1326525 [Mycena latifolia]|nr:hypothetical protein FB451DRAFT_1326525 [Mycena latifolia]
MGPAVLEIANALGVAVGSQLLDPQLLRLCVALSILTDDISPSIPKPPGPFGLGYTFWLPWAADREDYRAELDDPKSDRVLFAHSGWLYDTLGTEGLILLHQRERLKIVHRTNMPAKFSAVCMPHFRGDFVSLFPPRSPSTTILNGPTSAAIDGDEEIYVTFVLSRLQTDAFPLLSVCSPTGFAAPRGALAALIRVTYLGRVIETVWKPNVKQGAPCEHTALWRRATRAAPTAIELVLRVLPPSDASADRAAAPAHTELAFAASEDAAALSQKFLRELMDELSRRVAPLTAAGSPLERNRACIVRCGATDGAVDAVTVLAASVRKNVYILDRCECWECALIRMSEDGRTVGISIDTKL